MIRSAIVPRSAEALPFDRRAQLIDASIDLLLQRIALGIERYDALAELLKFLRNRENTIDRMTHAPLMITRTAHSMSSLT